MSECLTPNCKKEAVGGWYKGVPYRGFRDVRSASGSPPMYCKKCMDHHREAIARRERR